MPFDALVNKPVNLHDHLALLGIAPVSMETLNHHKVAQERLHRAHLLSTPWPVLTMSVIYAAIAGYLLEPGASLAFGAFMVMTITGLMTILTVGLIGAFLAITNIKVLGKAQWHEFEAKSFNDPLIPPAIREVVKEVRRTMPGKLYVGELRQNEVVLDPYIILVQNGERACLGIWEDDQVIACAETI